MEEVRELVTTDGNYRENWFGEGATQFFGTVYGPAFRGPNGVAFVTREDNAPPGMKRFCVRSVQNGRVKTMSFCEHETKASAADAAKEVVG
jgi:hypothetical protein